MIQTCNLMPFPVRELVQPSDFEFVEAAWCSYGPYYEWLTTQEGITTPLVLDNSTHLLGRPMPDEYVIELVRRLQYGWQDITVVLPDVKNNHEATVSLSKTFLREYGPILKFLGVRVMIVGQGKDVEEFRDCVQALYTLAGEQGFRTERVTLGVPYKTTFGVDSLESNWAMNRVMCVHHAFNNEFARWSRVHLLGLSDPMELTQYGKLDIPIFNDSSAAYMYAREGTKIQMRGWREMGRAKKPEALFDIFEVMEDPDKVRCLLHNVTMLRVLSGTRMEGDA